MWLITDLNPGLANSWAFGLCETDARRIVARGQKYCRTRAKVVKEAITPVLIGSLSTPCDHRLIRAGKSLLPLLDSWDKLVLTQRIYHGRESFGVSLLAASCISRRALDLGLFSVKSQYQEVTLADPSSGIRT